MTWSAPLGSRNARVSTDRRAGNLHLDPVVYSLALAVGHRAPLDADDHHAGLGIVELGAVLVGAHLGEQLGANFRQENSRTWRFA